MGLPDGSRGKRGSLDGSHRNKDQTRIEIVFGECPTDVKEMKNFLKRNFFINKFKIIHFSIMNSKKSLVSKFNDNNRILCSCIFQFRDVKSGQNGTKREETQLK